MASGSNLAGNLGEAERLIALAVQAGARVVQLPESFAFMGEKDTDVLKLTEAEGVGQIQNFLADQAARHQIWLIGGTVPLQAEDERHVKAACLVYNERGEQVLRYDKLHLFDVELKDTRETYSESATISAGQSLAWCDSPFGRLGFAICYDLRFPELFRELMRHDIEVFMIPSAFTATTGKAHWEPLIKARAIENLCYVVAADQGGYHVNGRETHGDSLIVDPWGNVLDRLVSGPGFAMADLDLAQLRRLRESFPALAHRRINCGMSHD